MKDLTLSEIIKLKKQLEFDITIKINEFNKLTNTSIESIQCHYITISNDEGESQKYLDNSTVNIDYE